MWMRFLIAVCLVAPVFAVEIGKDDFSVSGKLSSFKYVLGKEVTVPFSGQRVSINFSNDRITSEQSSDPYYIENRFYRLDYSNSEVVDCQYAYSFGEEDELGEEITTTVFTKYLGTSSACPEPLQIFLGDLKVGESSYVEVLYDSPKKKNLKGQLLVKDRFVFE